MPHTMTEFLASCVASLFVSVFVNVKQQFASLTQSPNKTFQVIWLPKQQNSTNGRAYNKPIP